MATSRQTTVLHRAFRGVSWTFWFLYSNVNDFMSVNGHYLAAAIAFYSFLSIFPLAIALITLWRFVVGIEGFEDRLITGIVNQIPVLAETEGPSFVERFIHNVSNDPAVTSSLTGLGLFVAGMGVFGSIRKSVNLIWGIQRPRPFLIERLIDFVMMTVASALLFFSLLLSVLFSFIQEIAGLLATEVAPFNQWILFVAGFVIPSAITYVVFIVVYWWLPNTKVRLTDIMGVAFLATPQFRRIAGLDLRQHQHNHDVLLLRVRRIRHSSRRGNAFRQVVESSPRPRPKTTKQCSYRQPPAYQRD